MRDVRLWVKTGANYQELDMFGSEEITINRVVKDVVMLGKQQGDNTQSFTIPASDFNNSVFSHYLKIDVVGSLDAHNKIDAFIEVAGASTTQGYIEFLGGRVEENRSSFYNVVFYGEIPNLSKIIGDKYLDEVDFTSFNHTLSYANVKSSWAGTLASGDILYPLIAYERDWIYSSFAGVDDKRNIADSSYGILLNEMKPAITFQGILDTIESEYGLTFNIDTGLTTYFDNTFMLLHRDAGDYVNDDVNKEESFAVEDNTYSVPGNTYNTPSWSELYDNGSNFAAGSGGFTAPYDAVYIFTILLKECEAVTVDVVSEMFYRINGAGNYFKVASIDAEVGIVKTKLLTVAVKLAASDTIDFSFKNATDNSVDYAKVKWTCKDINLGLYAQTVDLGVMMPKEYKVIDFLRGLIDMFNLVFEPVSATEFNVVPYIDWIEDGTAKDFTEYLDVSSIEVEKVPIYRDIKFKYSEATDIANEYFKEVGDREYGSCEYAVTDDFADSEYSINPKFTPCLPCALLDQDEDSTVKDDTGMMIVRMMDRDSKPVVNAPMIFYYTGVHNCSEYYLQNGFDGNGDPTFAAEDSYPLTSMFSDLESDSSTLSLNFSVEEPLEGLPTLKTLYSEFYGDYIQRLYDDDIRLITAKLVLPLDVYLNLAMNDQIILAGNYYTIDTFGYNYSTRVLQVKLLKYFPSYVRQKISTFTLAGGYTLNIGTMTQTLANLYNMTLLKGGTRTWFNGTTRKVTSRSVRKFPTELPLPNNNGVISYGEEIP